ncbi:Uncharacterised protein [Vibrio cholerae]|nr:Uncharacterised protein [Vibrio cholerae]CSD65121.1 Uncharacterised protein [Vibrio cholerae]CSI50113.1 Uncharacterised protein [Vibrio cholerae]
MIIYRVMHINPVSAHASLSSITKFRHHHTINRGINVRIFEHNKRRISSQLKREFFHVIGRLCHQKLANPG